MKRLLAVLLLVALLAGCGARTEETQEKEAPPVPETPAAPAAEDMAVRAGGTTDGGAAATDFAVELFRACQTGGNRLVSPLSVLSAMAMTANGAAGQTLEQMEKVFGMPLEALNSWLKTYTNSLGDTDGGRVRLANGIWVNRQAGLVPDEDFLQAVRSCYGAAVETVPFDSQTRDDINRWVSEHTAGRVDSIVDELDGGTALLLANALAFDGTWEEVYREDQVSPGTFTAADGRAQDAQFLWSTERGYLEDQGAVGFVKYYEGRQYAFAALLPKEGTALEDYIASLTGERLRAVLDGAREDVYVSAAIPKFSVRYGASLEKALIAMGMADAFDSGAADFSAMGACQAGPLYISRVLHRTYMAVDERGTEAGAATAVEVRAAGILGPEEQVRLDRPFVYMLIDCEENVPLFIGAMTALEAE